MARSARANGGTAGMSAELRDECAAIGVASPRRALFKAARSSSQRGEPLSTARLIANSCQEADLCPRGRRPKGEQLGGLRGSVCGQVGRRRAFGGGETVSFRRLGESGGGELGGALLGVLPLARNQPKPGGSASFPSHLAAARSH